MDDFEDVLDTFEHAENDMFDLLSDADKSLLSCTDQFLHNLGDTLTDDFDLLQYTTASNVDCISQPQRQPLSSAIETIGVQTTPLSSSVGSPSVELPQTHLVNSSSLIPHPADWSNGIQLTTHAQEPFCLQKQSGIQHLDTDKISVGQLTVEQLRQILMTTPLTPVTQTLVQPIQQTQVMVSCSRTNAPTLKALVAQPAGNCSEPATVRVAQSARPLPCIITSNVDKLAINRVQGQSKPKERRSSHNVIEKRYRMSINDKIGELKDILVGPGPKMNKSAVLRKAIEQVENLRNTNERLRHENATLRLALQKLGQSVDEILIVCPSKGEPLTPPFSYTSSPSSSSPDSPYCSSTYGDDMDTSVESHRGRVMVDGSRVALCMFMFVVLLFNPFGAVVSGGADLVGEYGSKGTTRVLHGLEVADNKWWFSHWIFSSMLSWSINVSLILLTLVWLLVYGEPVTESASKESTRYWCHHNQADMDLNKGFYASAAGQLKECLLILGRPYPTTRLELFSCLIWQLSRQVMHRTYVALVFNILAARIRSEAARSSKDAALIYHKLLQLALTGKIEASAWEKLNLALCSVNLAEAASGAIQRALLAEVYATAAVAIIQIDNIKITGQQEASLLARFLLGRCRKQCLRVGHDTVPKHLRWLCNGEGHRFFINMTWKNEVQALEGGFSSNARPHDPLFVIMQVYRQYLLEQSLSSLVRPDDGTNVSSALRHLEALNSTNPVTQKLASAQSSPYQLNGPFDELSHWWAAVVAVGVHWRNGEREHAERYYSIVGSLPRQLVDDKDPLPTALYDAFKARRGLTAGQMDVFPCTALCDRASAKLSESVVSNKATISHSKLRPAFELLACDWLLTTRTECWEKEVDCAPGSAAALDRAASFAVDVNTLQHLADVLPGVTDRMCLHTATHRMMLGANPTQTRQLLKRGLQNRTAVPVASGSSSMQGSLYLPSIYSRSDNKRHLLSQAAKSYDICGDASQSNCRLLTTTLGQERTNPIITMATST